MKNYVAYFTRDQEHQIHATTLRVLEEVGVRFQYQPSLEILKKAGCTVDGNRVYFPAKLVEAQVQKAPGEFTLFGRNAEKKDASALSRKPIVSGKRSWLIIKSRNCLETLKKI